MLYHPVLDEDRGSDASGIPVNAMTTKDFDNLLIGQRNRMVLYCCMKVRELSVKGASVHCVGEEPGGGGGGGRGGGDDEALLCVALAALATVWYG